jgi:6-pyruvoyltetrahydropterin/6-carboxytetrahydropterin synthase
MPTSADRTPTLLRRTVRFTLPTSGANEAFASPVTNAYAAWPTPRGLSIYGELEVAVRGEPDPTTGYLVDIVAIDRAVRERLLPFLAERFAAEVRTGRAIEPAALLPELANRLGPLGPSGTAGGRSCEELAWRLTPVTVVSFRTAMPDRIRLAQTFEFSASHRLHCPEYDDARNRAIFGKCNNPSGHGHNYRVAVEASVPLAALPSFGLPDLERIVDAAVIRRFDHKHLNSDCPEFATLNPSVEHIAAVCHRLLAQPLAAGGAHLERVTVWETEKTCAIYPA